MSATIRVGTCAWVEKGLIADWYPSTATTAEARLRFYAEHYDTVEVDSSYYAIPADRTVYNWGQRTPPSFVFHIKAFGLMTGHRVRPEQLPADLRTLVDEVTPQGYVVPSEALRDRVFARFRRALDPLRAEDKLGGVLFQLPPSAIPGRHAWEVIDHARAALPDDELLIEFRQHDWLAPDLQDETFSSLRERNLTYVVVDAPNLELQLLNERVHARQRRLCARGAARERCAARLALAARVGAAAACRIVATRHLGTSG